MNTSIPVRVTSVAREMLADRQIVEIVPAILRRTWEGIVADWKKIMDSAGHIQIDVTDGIFAGEGTFRDLRQFKKLPKSQKIELHLMVHTPGIFVDDIIDLNPARCIFHIESFSGTGNLTSVYQKLRESTRTELALAINPDSPSDWLEEYLPILNYVLFMGYNPGWANQLINENVFKKISLFSVRHPAIPIAVDGQVTKKTIGPYVKAGARILCANTSIFGTGNPQENLRQLELLAKSVL